MATMTVRHNLRSFLRCTGTLSLTTALALTGNLFAAKQAAYAAPSINKAGAETVHAAYDSLPTTFIANAGQLDASVRYEVRSSVGHLFFTPQGVTLAVTAADNAPVAPHDVQLAAQRIKPAVDAAPQTSIAMRVSFEGANANPVLGGADQLPGIANFFTGSDPTQWHTNVPTYTGVAYRDLYPGIDLSYTGHIGVLKGTYTVASGADPALIRWHYTGVNGAHIDATTGNLLIDAPAGVTLTEQVPEAWQIGTDGVQHTVTAHYALTEDGTARFTVGEYDHAQPLVIDPGLIYSTYLGGSGSDRGNGIAVDNSGSAYVTGNTTSVNFPTTVGTYQTTAGGGIYDAFVSKLNAAGSALVYSTYLGGSGSDVGSGIAVDSSGNTYVTGQTDSANFPTTAGAYQTTAGGGIYDVFVSKLNPAGSGLLYSTYLGGSGFDGGYGIAVDNSGSTYVTGQTDSANFPTTVGAYQTTFGGIYDAFVSKLNATGSGLTYSTYLGGSGSDQGGGIALDSSGSTYITGNTQSANFPTTVGAYQTTAGDNFYDAFVSKLNATGSGLTYSTYLGGNVYDSGSGIALDSSGNAYVTGGTSSANFPTTVGAYQTSAAGIHNAFVTKLNATGSGLLYSTCLGGSVYDSGYRIALDSSGNAYVTGETSSANFPTTVSAYQTTYVGSGDAFVAKLDLIPVPTHTDSIGIFRPSNATFYLRSSNTQGFADLTVQYGATNSYPVVGDWTGGGVSTIGVFNPTNGFFQLRNSNTPGAPDESFVLGIAGDQPLAGLWQAGATHDGVGVFRPSNGLIYLKNDLTTGYADHAMVLGMPGDIGIAGDWDGNGVSSPGVFRPNMATFYLSNQVVNGSVFGDYTVLFGLAGDVPFVGDWIAQGHAGVGVFRPTNGLLYLKNDLTTGFADVNIVYGIPNDVPVAGHWGISSPAPHNSVIVPSTALPAAATATPTQPALRLTQPSSYDG